MSNGSEEGNDFILKIVGGIILAILIGWAMVSCSQKNTEGYNTLNSPTVDETVVKALGKFSFELSNREEHPQNIYVFDGSAVEIKFSEKLYFYHREWYMIKGSRKSYTGGKEFLVLTKNKQWASIEFYLNFNDLSDCIDVMKCGKFTNLTLMDKSKAKEFLLRKMKEGRATAEDYEKAFGETAPAPPPPPNKIVL